MRHSGGSLCYGMALLMTALGLAWPAEAQRAANSSLLVNVTRPRTGGSSQQIALKISIRNMSWTDVKVDLAAIFVGDLIYRNGQETIFCERKTSAQLRGGETRDFETQSDTTYTMQAGFSYLSRSQYVKPKGYIVRVAANGQLVHVEATTPSLQKTGWDNAALDKLRLLEPPPPRVAGDLKADPPPPAQPARPETGVRPPPPVEPAGPQGDAARAATAGLAAYFRLDEPSGATTAADATGGGHDAYFIGGATAGVGGRTLQGVDLDRTSRGYLRVDMPLHLNANTVTMTVWVKRRGDQTDFSGIVFSRNANTVAGLHIGKQNGLRYTWNDSVGAYNWSSGLVLPDGKWAFAALVVEPERATIYLGTPGEELKSAVRSAYHELEEFDGTLCIGRDPNQQARFFDGQIDEIGIWRRALNRAELAALYEQGLAGTRLEISAGQPVPNESPAKTASPPLPAPPVAPVPAAPVPPPGAAPTLQTPGAPVGYQQTAMMYNKTIAAYQEYLRTRRTPANLKVIEDTLRLCADGFAACRNDAPADANIDSLIEQCNKAIFAVHATRLAPD